MNHEIHFEQLWQDVKDVVILTSPAIIYLYWAQQTGLFAYGCSRWNDCIAFGRSTPEIFVLLLTAAGVWLVSLLAIGAMLEFAEIAANRYIVCKPEEDEDDSSNSTEEDSSE